MTASLSEDADEPLLKAKLKVEKVPNLTFIKHENQRIIFIKRWAESQSPTQDNVHGSVAEVCRQGVLLEISLNQRFLIFFKSTFAKHTLLRF